MQFLPKSLILLLFTSAAGISAASPSDPLSVEPVRLEAHVEFLASDALQGRATGTREYQIAAEYVAAQFQQVGLTPAGDDDSYFQSVPLAERSLVDGSAAMVLENESGSFEFTYLDDFLTGPDRVRPAQSVTADTVFVGYGIVAPVFDHDDYQGLDVDGKIVVMLRGRPKAWPTEEGSHLASGREKVRHAAERGAVGVVLLSTPREQETFAWSLFQRYFVLPSMSWVNEAGIPDGYQEQIQGYATVNIAAAQKIFEGAARSAESIFAADSAEESINGFDLPGKITLKRESAFRELSSPNVLALIEGSDPALRDEVVVFTAHLDHLAMSKTAESDEDAIYNGAMDNATGVATLLETARVLSAEKNQLRRSVLFLVVTGEEEGLLGAGYFAKQSTVPIQQIVANINLDMPVLLYPFGDVVAFGAEHSSLKTSVARAAAELDIELSPDPMPEQGIFTRSDHYRLVQQGIPAVYLIPGHKSRDSSVDGKALYENFLKDHYHQPSDQTTLPIDYDAGALFAEININIARDVCNNADRPTWNEGDFFGDTFAGERAVSDD